MTSKGFGFRVEGFLVGGSRVSGVQGRLHGRGVRVLF